MIPLEDLALLDAAQRLEYDAGDLYAKNVDGYWRWATHGETGWQIHNAIGWLFAEMVEAAWSPLPSDYVPPEA